MRARCCSGAFMRAATSIPEFAECGDSACRRQMGDDGAMSSEARRVIVDAPGLRAAGEELDRAPAARPEGDGWPRGIPTLLGAVGAIGMSLIGLSNVALGPHGPTGSVIERDVVSVLPRNAVVPIGATSMTIGLVLVLG